MAAHSFNPNTQETEAGKSLWVQGQPGLQELVPVQAQKLHKETCLEKSHTQKRDKGMPSDLLTFEDKNLRERDSVFLLVLPWLFLISLL